VSVKFIGKYGDLVHLLPSPFFFILSSSSSSSLLRAITFPHQRQPPKSHTVTMSTCLTLTMCHLCRLKYHHHATTIAPRYRSTAWPITTIHHVENPSPLHHIALLPRHQPHQRLRVSRAIDRSSIHTCNNTNHTFEL